MLVVILFFNKSPFNQVLGSGIGTTHEVVFHIVKYSITQIGIAIYPLVVTLASQFPDVALVGVGIVVLVADVGIALTTLDERRVELKALNQAIDGFVLKQVGVVLNLRYLGKKIAYTVIHDCLKVVGKGLLLCRSRQWWSRPPYHCC